MWLEIIIKDSNISIPSHLLKDGKVYLEVNPDESLETVRNNILLNKDGENIGDATLAMNLPYGIINNLVLSPLIDPSVVGQSFGSLSCEVYARGDLLPFGKVRVLSRSDEERTFSVEFVVGENHPLKLAQNFRLCDLSFTAVGGGFQLTKENVEAQFGDYEYQDGDNGYYWGFDWFGKALKTTYLTVEDLRPRYSPLYILRQGFLQLGWQFKSDILETSFWRKVWLYLSDSKYGGNSLSKLERYKFLLAPPTVGQTVQSYGNSPGKNQIPLNSVYTLNATYRYDGSNINFYNYLNEKVIIEYELDVSNISRDNKLSFGIRGIFDGAIAYFQPLIDVTLDLEVDEERVYKGTVNAITNGKAGYGWVYSDFPNGVIVNKWKVYSEPIRLRYHEYQFIWMNDPLSCEIDLYQVLKGVQHAVGGIINVDFSKREVELASFEDIDVHGDAVTGYYLKEPTLREDSIICKSRRIQVPDYGQARYVNIGFKKSKDAYIKSLNYGEETQPFDKSIDIGAAFEPNTDENRNPLFEPTEMIPVDIISKSFPVHLGAMLDNYGEDEPDYSYDIGPRMGLCVGPTQQRFKDETGAFLGYPKLFWYDEELDDFPIFINDIREKQFDLLDLQRNPVSSNLYLAYGSGGYSFWDMYLMRRLLTRYLSQEVVYDIWMNPSAYSLFSLRNRTSIVYWYEHIAGIVDNLRYNHRTGEGSMTLVTPLESYSLTDVSVLEESTENEIKCANNKPGLLISPGTTIVFTLGGSLVSTLDQVVFEYRLADVDGRFTSAFSVLTNTTSVTAELANPLESYQIKMTVKYLTTNGVSCPDYVILDTVDPCQNFSDPLIENVYSVANKLGGKRITLNNSIFNETVNNIVSTVRINGGAPQAYTIDPVTLYGTYVYNLDPDIFPNFILETMVITFTSGCVYTLPSPISNLIKINRLPNTPPVEGTLEIKQAGMGTAPGEGRRYLPELSSIVLDLEPISTTIYYRTDKTNPFGEVWNRGVGPVGYNPEFKVVFDFGDGNKTIIGWQTP